MAGRRSILIPAVAVLLLAACGKGKLTDPNPPPGTNAVANGLRFTRLDSTSIVMGRTYAVCCSTWERNVIDREALKIFFYDPRKQQSYWKMFVIPSAARGDSIFPLPTQSPGEGPVMVSVSDVGTGNEARSDRPGSSGTVTIHSLTCGVPARIDATVDALLQSIVPGREPIRVRGRFTAVVYTNPISCVFSF